MGALKQRSPRQVWERNASRQQPRQQQQRQRAGSLQPRQATRGAGLAKETGEKIPPFELDEGAEDEWSEEEGEKRERAPKRPKQKPLRPPENDWERLVDAVGFGWTRGIT